MNKKKFLLRVDPKQLLELKRLGKKKGGMAVSQLIRLAVSDYLEREKMEKR